jgi:lysozyme
MKPRHQVSRAAIELIKRFEGYRSKAAQLPDGRWTIGYGHTLTARQGAEVSENDAEALLIYDLIAVAHVVNEQTYAPLTQNQFDALCAFAFNIGVDNFRRSAVLKRINEGAMIQAAFGMELWRKADFEGERIVIDALVRRRAAEKALFLTPPGGLWVPAPSPILQPTLDLDAPDLAPQEAPTPLVTLLEGERILVLRDDQPAPAPISPDDPGPVKAAAEEVTARLQTIFQEPAEPAEASEPPEAADEPRPQADFAPPITVAEEPPAVELDGEPFELSPEPLPEPDLDHAPPQLHETEAETEEPGPDLFDKPAPANDADVQSEAETILSEAAEGRDRVVIDDIAPFEFVAPAVQPLPQPRQDGLFTEVLLAILGLVFFGGGIFWAIAARTAAGARLIDPRMVGVLAGIAGIGFFVVATFMMLQRLGRVSEGRDKPRA